MFEEYGEAQLTVCAYAYGWNLGQNLFQTHRKNTFFPCHPGKNGNRRHINVRFPLLLFQSHESYALPDVGFETKANLNRGWAGFLLFLFRDDGSVRKS